MAVNLAQPNVDDQLLDQITQHIVAGFNPYKVILFGSYAYGRPTPESDVDLLVIMDSKESSAHRSSAVSLACRPKLLAMDVLVRTPQEVEDRLQRGDTFLRDILERGRVLYERHLG